MSSKSRKSMDDLAERFKSEVTVESTTPAKLTKPTDKAEALVRKFQKPGQTEKKKIRLSVDIEKPLYDKLATLAQKAGRKKVDILRQLLEETFEGVE